LRSLFDMEIIYGEKRGMHSSGVIMLTMNLW
jgi:hypothetical protein